MSRDTVAVYPYRSDAEIAVARLAADGIDAVIYQDDEGGLNPGFFKRYGVRVEVAGEDFEDALESLGIERIKVRDEVAEAMFRHSGFCHPNEACGLVALDSDGDARFAVCLTNTDESSHRFTINPAEYHGSLLLVERFGLEIGGAFHSHLRSEAYPSAADINGGLGSDWVHFIVGPVVGGLPLLRAYRVNDGEVVELSVTVGE